MEEEEMEKIWKFFKDESGANMVEYALLLALIALVSIAALQILGPTIAAKFTEANTAINGT